MAHQPTPDRTDRVACCSGSLGRGVQGEHHAPALSINSAFALGDARDPFKLIGRDSYRGGKRCQLVRLNMECRYPGVHGNRPFNVWMAQEHPRHLTIMRQKAIVCLSANPQAFPGSRKHRRARAGMRQFLRQPSVRVDPVGRGREAAIHVATKHPDQVDLDGANGSRFNSNGIGDAWVQN